MAKLTQRQNREVPFELCFKYPLENGYTFKELTPENIRQFQAFLNKVSQMTVLQVDQSFARKPDTNDRYHGMQVYHYEVSEGRSHVYVVREREGILGMEYYAEQVSVRIADQNDYFVALENAPLDQEDRIIISSTKALENGEIVRLSE